MDRHATDKLATLIHEAVILSIEWNSDWTETDFFKRGEAAQLTKSQETVGASYGAEIYDPNYFGGEKYPGGLSAVSGLFQLDYWSLRQRSAQLFHRNAYARGIVRRLVTSVIGTGLHLESTPNEKVIGVPEDSLIDWSEDIENRFSIYEQTPSVVDYHSKKTLGQLQAQIKLESWVGGDCLVIFRQHKKYKLPTLQIISGDRIKTPLEKMMDPKITDGVEFDDQGRHFAYYIEDPKAKSGYRKILARGKNTGRTQAELVYGCDKREDGVRGVPLIGIAIQPLAEIDRHRDSAQRKATLNSMVVAAVKRSDNNRRQTQPLTGGGAARKGRVDVVDNSTGDLTQLTMSDLVPGVNMQHMAHGEEVHFFNNNGVDINFGAFEATILMGVAWALEIPPEILFLSFNKSFSASQAANNDFKIYLNKDRVSFAAQLLDPLYQEWFLSMLLLDKISAGTYLSDLHSAARWDIARAWTIADWSGAIKPSTDMLKTANAYARMVDNLFISRARATREISGQKFSTVARLAKKENEMMADAMRPMLELEKEYGADKVERAQAEVKRLTVAKENGEAV